MIIRKITVDDFPLLGDYSIDMTKKLFDKTVTTHMIDDTSVVVNHLILEQDDAKRGISHLFSFIKNLLVINSEYLSKVYNELDTTTSISKLDIEFYNDSSDDYYYLYSTRLIEKGFLNQSLHKVINDSIHVPIFQKSGVSNNCLISSNIYFGIEFLSNKDELLDSNGNLDLLDKLPASNYGDAYDLVKNIFNSSSATTDYIINCCRQIGLKIDGSLVNNLRVDSDSDEIKVHSIKASDGKPINILGVPYCKKFLTICRIAASAYLGDNITIIENIDEIFSTYEISRLLTFNLENGLTHKSQIIVTFNSDRKVSALSELLKNKTYVDFPKKLQVAED